MLQFMKIRHSFFDLVDSFVEIASCPLAILYPRVWKITCRSKQFYWNSADRTAKKHAAATHNYTVLKPSALSIHENHLQSWKISQDHLFNLNSKKIYNSILYALQSIAKVYIKVVFAQSFFIMCLFYFFLFFTEPIIKANILVVFVYSLNFCGNIFPIVGKC